MECIYCKGTLVYKTTSYTASRQGYHLIIDSVPAWVCEQCGEPLFDERAVDTIQGMLREIGAGMERLTTSVAPA